MYQYTYIVGENDLQPDYFHVHHARSLLFLEQARVRFMQDIGCPHPSLIAQGIFSVVASLSIRYKRELLAGEIKVTCEDLKIEGRSLVVRQRIFNQKGKEVIDAQVEIMFLRSVTKRAGEVPEKIVEALQ